MRRSALLLLSAALLLTGCGAADVRVPRAGQRPLKVMSLNMCLDQIVLALLPPGRITSVTFLSRDPGSSLMHAEAMRVGTNEGSIEEVIRQRPDLVIAGSFTTSATRAMLKRLNYPMLEIPEASDFAGIRDQTRRIAAAVGKPARGEALIAEMDRELAALSRTPGPPLRIAAWDRSGFSGAQGTLQDAVFTAAGARNIAKEPPASAHGQPDAEVLLAAAPDLLVQGSRAVAAPSQGDALVHHRVVRRFWGRDRMLTVPQAYYVCGTPRIGRAVAALQGELRRADAQTRSPLRVPGR